MSKTSENRTWVNCPICDETDMRREAEAGCDEGGGYIHCVNLNCRSNGGTQDSALAAERSEIKRLKEGWIGADAKASLLKKEADRLRQLPVPSCAHCRGEIGVVLTTLTDLQISKVERDQVKAENAALKRELEEARAERDRAKQEWREDFEVRTHLLSERDAAIASKDQLQSRVEELEGDREAFRKLLKRTCDIAQRFAEEMATHDWSAILEAYVAVGNKEDAARSAKG